MTNELHPEKYLRPGGPQWWACSEPERPLDFFTCWDTDCPKCMMKAELTLRVEGDVPVRRLVNGTFVDSTLAGSVLKTKGER